MSEFTYLQSKNGTRRRVKSGFNWYACIFGALWAFANRAWLLGLLLLLPALVLKVIEQFVYSYVEGAAGSAFVLGLYLAVMYVCGRNGNAWLARSLQWQGYREVGREAV